jgi:hypothetical protein
MAEDHLWELENLLCCIDELLLEGGHTAAFLQWKADADAAIRCAFGERSREVSMFANIRYTPLTHAACLSDGDKAVAFQRGLAQARLVLQTLARRLREGRSG